MDNKRGVEGGGMGEVADVAVRNNEELKSTVAGEAKKGEVTEKRVEVGSSIVQGMPTRPVVPAIADGKTGDDGSAKGDLVNLTTKDGETIEKEWVKRIRDVMGETKENPRKREDEIFEIKKDFILKRFGRKIGGGK